MKKHAIPITSSHVTYRNYVPWEVSKTQEGPRYYNRNG